MRDLLKNKLTPVTLYGILLTFRDKNKKLVLKKKSCENDNLYRLQCWSGYNTGQKNGYWICKGKIILMKKL